MGSMTVSGKIKSKKVKTGPYGDLVIFQVGGQTLSVFANAKNLSQDAKNLIRELSEGDEAEFQTYESTGKDGKTYQNIGDVIKVSRLGGDEEMDYNANAPGDKTEKADKTEKPVQPVGPGASRDDMMMKSYAKDATNVIFQVACANMDPNDEAIDQWIQIYDKIYSHIKGE